LCPGPLAQLVEQGTLNPKVEGSSPSRPTLTGKADFTEQEWELLLEGPPIAGLIVLTAQRGGTFRETLAMGKAYAEARRQHGESELLDEILAAKPKVHTRYRSPDELRQHGLERLREAGSLLRLRGTSEELEGYRRFVLTVAEKVANAHREGGVSVSAAEQAAIDEISAALSGPAEG
jgi:hypothetical protein